MSDIDVSACHFCDALWGRIHSEPRAFDDGQFAVLMGRYQPTGPGYALVVPYPHVQDLHSLPDDDCGPTFQMVRRTSAAVRQAFDVSGTTVMQNNGPPGQSVKHLHFHVIPRGAETVIRDGRMSLSRTPCWRAKPLNSPLL